MIKETARFVDDRTVAAGDRLIRARRFVIATGSSPAIPPIPGLAETPFLTNETLFGLKRLPRHLLVIGAGAVGLEMAGAHRRLGADVTVVDGAAALSGQDPELAAIVLDGLRAEGMLLHERTAIRSAEQTETGLRLLCGTRAALSRSKGATCWWLPVVLPITDRSTSMRPASAIARNT